MSYFKSLGEAGDPDETGLGWWAGPGDRRLSEKQQAGLKGQDTGMRGGTWTSGGGAVSADRDAGVLRPKEAWRDKPMGGGAKFRGPMRIW